LLDLCFRALDVQNEGPVGPPIIAKPAIQGGGADPGELGGRLAVHPGPNGVEERLPDFRRQLRRSTDAYVLA
jgi:hypothetical protein